MSGSHRTYAILQGLADTDGAQRDAGREPSFILIRMAHGRSGLKPSFDGAWDLKVTEGDLRDLEDAGYIRELSSSQADVLMKFQLTAAGRAAGARAPVAVELDMEAQPITAPETPDVDDVLRWMDALDATTLSQGINLVNAALAHFGEAQLDSVCRLLFDLRDDRLIRFTDVMARLTSWPAPDRIAKGTDFRLTVVGRDRIRRRPPPHPAGTTQNFYGPVSQVAGRDINVITNLTSIQALEVIDRALEDLDKREAGNPDSHEGARRLLENAKTRGLDVLTGAAGSAAGALALTLFQMARQRLGL